MEHFDAISRSPSQIYHSALPFSPSSSWLCNYYTTELSKEVKVVLGLPAKWGACSRTVVTDTIPYCSISWKNTIAVGLHSGDIIILDGTTGSQVATLSGHTERVYSLAVSSDGALFVSGSADNTIKQWDLQTGGVIKTLHGHTGAVTSVSISADYATIASASDNAKLHLWDIHTGECHHIMTQMYQAKCVSFSPTDPQHLIFASDRGVQQWEIGGHGINHTYNGSYATFSPDGTQFASCKQSCKTVVVRNSGSGAIVAEFTVAHNTYVEYCCFSPDGTLIAAATSGAAIEIWDITGSSPHLIETFVGHIDIIWSIVFSSPSCLISSSEDSSVKFWEITVPSTDQVAAHPKTTSLASAQTRLITLQAEDGITISIDSDGVVKVWDLSTGICKASFQTPIKDVGPFDVRLIDNRLIFVWFEDWKIHVYDVEKEKFLCIWNGGIHSYLDIKISGDGLKVFCLDGFCISAQSTKTGEDVGAVLHSVRFARSIFVDGSRAWVQGSEFEIHGWDFGVTDSIPVEIPGLPSLSFCDTKWWDISLSRIWDTVTGQVIFEMGGRHRRPVNVQLSGKYVATHDGFGEILVLDFNHVLS